MAGHASQSRWKSGAINSHHLNKFLLSGAGKSHNGAVPSTRIYKSQLFSQPGASVGEHSSNVSSAVLGWCCASHCTSVEWLRHGRRREHTTTIQYHRTQLVRTESKSQSNHKHTTRKSQATSIVKDPLMKDKMIIYCLVRGCQWHYSPPPLIR